MKPALANSLFSDEVCDRHARGLAIGGGGDFAPGLPVSKFFGPLARHATAAIDAHGFIETSFFLATHLTRNELFLILHIRHL